MPSDVYYFIELKPYSGADGPQILHSLIKSYNLKGRVIWGCVYDADIAGTLNSLDPEIPLFCTSSEITRVGVLYLLGLLWLFPLRHDVFSTISMTREEVENQKWKKETGQITSSRYNLLVYGGRLVNWLSMFGMLTHL